MTLTIKEITEKKDFKTFIRFANELYKDNDYYVPDIMSGQIAAFDRDKNPAYEYCDTKCFLVYSGKKVVGRIAAIHNTKVNAKNGENHMRFWHADYIDDDKVVDMLFQAVEQYAKSKGCTAVYGPMGFSDMDREGLLVEGFDQLSMFQTYYNHPYYAQHMERMGYVKNVDWVEYKVFLNEHDERIKKLARIAATVEKRQKLTLVTVRSKKLLTPYVESVFKLYNEVYTLYGMVPLTERQVAYYVEELLPLVDQRTTAIVLDEQGNVVAFGIGAPTLSHALRKCGGRLFPFGWFHILRALKGKNDTLDLFLIAVHPDFQNKGVNAMIMNHIVQFGISHGVKYAETSPELETNTKVRAQWRFFDTEQHKRRRCYIKQLY